MPGEPTLEELLALMVPQTLHAESRNRDFDAQGRPVTSPAGAKYAMQVMPGTGLDPGFGVRPAADPNDPAEMNRVGRDYLGAMLKRYDLDPAKAWAAYNAGPGRLDKALGSGGNWLRRMPGETRSYVAQNLAALQPRLAQSAPQPTSPAMPDSPLASLLPTANQEGPAPEHAGKPSALDTLTQILGGYQKLDEDRAAMRQQQLEMARASLEEKRKGFSSTDLFKLSAALAMPQRYKGFGGMLANVAPALAEIGGDHEAAAKARRTALQQLQAQYMGGTLDDRGKSLGSQLDVARAMTSAEPGRPRQTWSESLGRFVSPDRREVVGQGVMNGMRVLKYSDGTMGVPSADGTITLYDAAGRKVGVTTQDGEASNGGA